MITTMIRNVLLALTLAGLCVTAPALAATTYVRVNPDGSVNLSVPPMTNVTVKVSPAHAAKAPLPPWPCVGMPLPCAEANCERGTTHCQIRPQPKASAKP